MYYIYFSKARCGNKQNMPRPFGLQAEMFEGDICRYIFGLGKP